MTTCSGRRTCKGYNLVYLVAVEKYILARDFDAVSIVKVIPNGASRGIYTYNARYGYVIPKTRPPFGIFIVCPG